MPLNIPAPPEAKLTPLKKDTFLLFFTVEDARERYGGEVERPTFSAVTIIDLMQKLGKYHLYYHY